MSMITWVRAWVRPMPIADGVVESAVVAQRHDAGVVDPVLADPVVAVGAGAGRGGLGAGGIGGSRGAAA